MHYVAGNVNFLFRWVPLHRRSLRFNAQLRPAYSVQVRTDFLWWGVQIWHPPSCKVEGKYENQEVQKAK
jgi:hypothetical protein